jgi:hypothetical protein
MNKKETKIKTDQATMSIAIRTLEDSLNPNTAFLYSSETRKAALEFLKIYFNRSLEQKLDPTTL